MHHPANNAIPTLDANKPTLQLIIGSRRYPECPMDSVGEQRLHFREAAGVFYGESDVSIKPVNFANRKTVFGWDLEKVGAKERAPAASVPKMTTS
jgi:hypothetical protein